MTARARVPQAEITRAFRAARAAGYPSVRVRLDPDGSIEIFAALCSKRTKAVTGVITRDAGATSCDAAPLKE